MNLRKPKQRIYKAVELEGSIAWPQIPMLNQISKLGVGSFIKIKIQRESFWCEITAVEDEAFIASIGNELVFSDEHGLQYEDLIEVQFDEVLDYMKLTDSLSYDRYKAL